MMRGTYRRTVLVAAVLAVAPALVTAQAASGETPAVWSPEQVPAMFGRTYVTAMSSTSSADVYAAGLVRTFLPGAIETRTLVLHYDGSSWSRMVTRDRETAPARNQLNGISAAAIDDVWAVGSAGRPFSGSFAALVEHYDGSDWTIVPAPDTGIYDSLHAVSALQGGSVWTVGSKGLAGVGFVPLVLQRRTDGSWNELAFPVPLERCVASSTELTSVAATSDSDVYVTGSCRRDGGDHGFVAWWNGSAWSTVVTAPAGSRPSGVAGGLAGTPAR